MAENDWVDVIDTQENDGDWVDVKMSPKPSFDQRMGIGAQLGQSFEDTAKGIYKGIINPPYKAVARFLQGVEQLATDKTPQTYGIPRLGIDIVNPLTSNRQGIREGLGNVAQNISMLFRPFTAGALYVGGKALEEGRSPADIAKQTILGGTIGKGFGLMAGEPLLTGRVGKFARNISQESARRSYEKTLGATTKSEKVLAEKVAPELVKRKPFIWTREGFKKAAERKMQTAGESIEAGYAALPETAKVKVRPIVDAITQKRESLKINGRIPDESKTFANQLDRIYWDFVNTVDYQNATPSTIRQYRQVLDKALEGTRRGFTMTGRGSAKLDAQNFMANTIRKELAKQYPSIGNLNKEFSFWSRATELLESTAGKGKGIAEKIGGAIGVGQGSHQYYIFLRNIGRLIDDNVAWNSFAGSQKARIAELLSKGNIEEANSIIMTVINKAKPILNSMKFRKP